MFPVFPPPVSVAPYNPNDPRRGRGWNYNPSRPISGTDSAATTGLVVNPNGTYVSSNGAFGGQGQFGATLPTVNVGVQGGAQPARSPLFNAIQQNPQAFGINLNQAPSTQGYNTTPSNYYNPDLGAAASGVPAGTPPGALPKPGTPESLALAQGHYEAGNQMRVDIALTKLEQGDLSGLEWLPQEDLEAMGLGDLAGAPPKGGASDPNRRGAQGIGTGVDESKDMTPAQKEARYWHNKEVEYEFLRQQRWNPDTKKYESVGKWLNREKGKYAKGGRRRYRGGTSGPAQDKPKDKSTNYTIQQYGVVNFNTATG